MTAADKIGDILDLLDQIAESSAGNAHAEMEVTVRGSTQDTQKTYSVALDSVIFILGTLTEVCTNCHIEQCYKEGDKICRSYTFHIDYPQDNMFCDINVTVRKEMS